MIDIDDEDQPNSAGNRHYDYLTADKFHIAEESLKHKEKWRDLNSHEIVVLRQMATDFDFRKDIVDHLDRLALLKCLFVVAENRNDWRKNAYNLGYNVDEHGWAIDKKV